MTLGIPYFGENNQEIYDKILSSEINKQLEIESIYKFINDNVGTNIVVVIDNKWLTWLKDIKFNYKDKRCYIPYFEYEVTNISDLGYRGTNKGHLPFINDTLYVRYNYNYKELDIVTNNCKYIIYDLDTDKKIEIIFKNWINEENFDIDKLYNLYIDSCYVEDDKLITDYNSGYHYINKELKQFRNKEKRIRKDLGLNDFVEDCIIPIDYRDVRSFKYDEVVQLVGFRDTIENYNIRRLKFESYLYCLIESKLKSNSTEFNRELARLGKSKHIIKYGNNIKLIFKEYWFSDIKQYKTWSRT